MDSKTSLPIVLLALLLMAQGCSKPAVPGKEGALKAVATIFPVYDFAKSVSGGRVAVTMLIPPGMETHEFEPKPSDVMRAHNADFFIYTGDAMESWAGSLLKAVNNPAVEVIDSSRGAAIQYVETGAFTGKRSGADPHIWLDIENAKKMVDNIAEGFSKKDSVSREFYMTNAAKLKAELNDLDTRYKAGLKNCRQDIVVHAGHYSLGYLTSRYGIKYEAAVQSTSEAAEPSTARIAYLAGLVKKNSLKHVFYDEMTSPSLADTLTKETSSYVTRINSLHNVSMEDFHNKRTYLSIMETNLGKLQDALECPK